MPGQVNDLYAYVVTDHTGEEAIPAVKIGDTVMLLIGTDRAQVDQWQPVAQALAETAHTVSLRRYQGVEILDTLQPTPRGRVGLGMPGWKARQDIATAAAARALDGEPHTEPVETTVQPVDLMAALRDSVDRTRKDRRMNGHQLPDMPTTSNPTDQPREG